LRGRVCALQGAIQALVQLFFVNSLDHRVVVGRQNVFGSWQEKQIGVSEKVQAKKTTNISPISTYFSSMISVKTYYQRTFSMVVISLWKRSNNDQLIMIKISESARGAWRPRIGMFERAGWFKPSLPVCSLRAFLRDC
jgi:hypothetical protein